MSDWRDRAKPATEEEVLEATDAGWRAKAKPDQPAGKPVPGEASVGPGVGGYVKSVDPNSEEAAIADLNTKRGKEEGPSNARIALLEKLLAAAQTGSLGFGDEMKGAVDAAGGGDYRQAQQSAQKEIRSAQKQHPWSSLAGALPSAVVGAPVTLGARLLGAGAVGAAAGVGNSEETLDNPGGIAKDALVGGASSVALQGVGEGVAKGSGLLAKYLKQKLAPQWAVKAAGVRGGIGNVPQKHGIETQSELEQLGREALDADLIPFGGSKEAVADRAAALQSRAGNSIGAQLSKADVSGVPADYDAAQWAAIQPAMEGTVLARNKSGAPVRDLLRALQQQAEETPGSFKMLNATKSDMGKNVNWNAVPKGTGGLVKKTYGALNEEVANQVGNAAGPETAAALREANKSYGLAKTVGDLAKDTGLRESSNRGVGLSELLLGTGGAAGGAALGGPGGAAVGGAGMAMLSNLLRKRGPAAGARLADDLAAPLASGVSQALPAAVRAPELDEETRQMVARYLGLTKP